MAYSIKDAETDAVIRRLAKVKGKPIVDAIREACVNELERERQKTSLWERLQPVVERVAAFPQRPEQTHLSHKAYFDDMWGDDK